MSGGAGGAGEALRRLTASCASVAAAGTDPELLARVLGWSVRPRRSPDALRRACRDAAVPLGPRDLSVAIGTAVTDDDAASAEPLVGRWRADGVRAALIGDPGYPARLAEGWPHTDGPIFLAWRGCPPDNAPAVALVGARRATSYGLGVTAWLAEAAARAGIRVLSGGAVGIDAAAHEAAVELPGGTTVVLGCGHGVRYPRGHANPGGLFDRIVDHGGTIVGELLPHEPPRAGQVRARNRIVAALADVVVVIEGGARSGALLTAGAAADRGRAVLAVPGDIRAPGSAAPHRLLAEGAAPCTDPADLLAAVGSGGLEESGTGQPRDGHGATRSPAVAPRTEASGSAGREAAGSVVSTLPPEIHRVLADAWPRAMRVEQLAVGSGRAVPLLLAALTRARIAGEVVESVEGVRLRRAPG